MRKHRDVFSLGTLPRMPKSWPVLPPPRAVLPSLPPPRVLPRVVLLCLLLSHLLAPLYRLLSQLSSNSEEKSRLGLELEPRAPALE